ncbi:putative U3 small nucleolar RNA-associated protein 11 [Leptodactylus fuscus]|uniref:putative U3 small nucleolar RNA-associated protein 11 n=1 Tax=Leptodactylus fuscus TaxID=238119 RepID=UPI003F4E72F1
MSAAFRKALKSRQKDHKERSQPGFRKNLGLLEKKKDYKLRADDFHKKKRTLNALRKKALEKNPDEFYFKMTSTKLRDGVHVIKQNPDEITDEQLKIMRTQDLKYVEMKRVAEAKKIERLKSELHLLDVEGKPKNTHTFFCDTKKEVRNFDLAKRLNTAPELVDRVYNRPSLETLHKQTIKGPTQSKILKTLAKQRRNQYEILNQRIERERKMFVISQKIQARKDLMEKREKVKVKKETVNSAAIYKFKKQRKR